MADLSSRPGSPAAVPAPGAQSMQSGLVRSILVGLAALGLLVPWYFNVQYFLAGGSLMPEVFFRDAAANLLTTGITIDVYLAALAFSTWVVSERRVRHPWLYVLGCFGISLAFVLPLYLLLRSSVSSPEQGR